MGISPETNAKDGVGQVALHNTGEDRSVTVMP
jgi:hypothetical protein